ncbi:MAG: hypothetical protein AAF211_22805 [Myxococcota bacterium]
MALDLELDVGHLTCWIGEHRLLCTSRHLAIGTLRVPRGQVVDLRVSRRLFFVEVATRTGTHRFYAKPRPWEDGDWKRLANHLTTWHQRGPARGDQRDVPHELLVLRARLA